MEQVRVKFFDEACRFEKFKQGDWIDLRAREDVYLERGKGVFIPLGVAMELPEGYEAHIVPRSSSFKRWGFLQANSVGIIDNSYCGDNDEWGFFAYATRNASIRKGDRVCQFRIVKNQPAIEFEMVEYLGNADRGGWGSTGVE